MVGGFPLIPSEPYDPFYVLITYQRYTLGRGGGRGNSLHRL